MNASNFLHRRAWLALPLLAAARALPAAEAAALRIGLAPYLSPTAMLGAFRPVREHLQRALGQNTEMFTARDFVHLVQAVRRGEFDLVLLPAHVARLAMLDWGWQPVAGTVDRFDVLVLVKGDGALQATAELRGRRIGVLDALSLTATVGRRWLQEQRLAAEVTLVPQMSINGALHALEHGEVDAVVAGSTQLLDLPAGTPRNHRVLARVPDLPGPMYLAHPEVRGERIGRLRAALMAFRPDPARPITAANARLHPPDADTLQRLDDYAVIARQALAGRR